ncbi:hypothetical protein AB0N28_23900 [Streptomyces sp. NPDC051130]|uniref:hypothetical protein n=1 Tax=Streptomyces sp. NPDC051130 TaxID=3157223 RepID=UPI0034166300
MSHLRRIGVITGAALLLTATATACSAGKTTVGGLSFRAQDGPAEVTYLNTPVQGCHKIGLPRGAAHVDNNTLVDVILYRTPGCQKADRADGVYIPTSTSNVTAPGSLPWRSFSVVH